MQVRTLLLLVAIASFTGLAGCIQKNNDHAITVAFYNCENFFDPVDDPAKDDDDFTPNGKYHYTQRVYEQKLHNIATVIQGMDGSDGPAIIGVAEVENSTVLNDLSRQPEIARRNYKYEWYNGPDPRGINVALLYNPKLFRVLHSEPLHVDLSADGGRSVTRDVLHVYGILAGDTVHVFVNHWPSRRGGEDASDDKRAIAAWVNKDAISAIMQQDPNAKVIVMGDLNDNPGDNSIANILGAKDDQNKVTLTVLYDPWAAIYKGGSGTESFKHSWNLFDQVIISGAFLQNTNHKLHYGKAAIVKPDFIVDHYKGHDGEPRRSFAGTHWINGYSDHFPVMVYFTN
ncbi:MAG: endonuclease [Flavipsychrobacter sp.]|nr:endonuclease [Flavipsychrobacter sp.]